METKPRTNADRIRAMSDKELAEYLAKRYTLCARCFFRRTYSNDPIGPCLECCLAWLRSPAESEGEE